MRAVVGCLVFEYRELEAGALLQAPVSILQFKHDRVHFLGRKSLAGNHFFEQVSRLQLLNLGHLLSDPGGQCVLHCLLSAGSPSLDGV